MYLPYTAGSLASGQLIPAQAYADHLATVIASESTPAAAYTTDTVVVSLTRGVATPITSLKIDSKPDTQRGRQGKLTPATSYVAAVV